MRISRAVLFLLLVAAWVSCKAIPILGPVGNPTPDRVETWALLPFYGELRFLIADKDTGAAIPGATLQVLNLRIEELEDETGIASDQDGRIVVRRRYLGEKIVDADEQIR